MVDVRPEMTLATTSLGYPSTVVHMIFASKLLQNKLKLQSQFSAFQSTTERNNLIYNVNAPAKDRAAIERAHSPEAGHLNGPALDLPRPRY